MAGTRRHKRRHVPNLQVCQISGTARAHMRSKKVTKVTAHAHFGDAGLTGTERRLPRSTVSLLGRRTRRASPDFIVVGATQAGWTSNFLAAELRSAPDRPERLSPRDLCRSPGLSTRLDDQPRCGAPRADWSRRLTRKCPTINKKKVFPPIAHAATSMKTLTGCRAPVPPRISPGSRAHVLLRPGTHPQAEPTACPPANA